MDLEDRFASIYDFAGLFADDDSHSRVDSIVDFPAAGSKFKCRKADCLGVHFEKEPTLTRDNRGLRIG